MRVIKREIHTIETVTTIKDTSKEADKKPIVKSNKTGAEISVEIEMDTIDQKYQLGNFLREKGFHQSDGIMGEQRDFGIWMENSTHSVKLRFINEIRFKHLYGAAMEWVNLNSK